MESRGEVGGGRVHTWRSGGTCGDAIAAALSPVLFWRTEWIGL